MFELIVGVLVVSTLLHSIIRYLEENRNKKRKMDAEEAAAAVLFFGIFLEAENTALEEDASVPRKKLRTTWTRPWILNRATEGCSQKLLQEFSAQDDQKHLYENFLRMDSATFEELLELVSPLIQKQETNMRKPISPRERLAVTLRFLASGDSFHSLAALFRIPHNSISTIVPEVSDAIYTVLKDKYLKVCVMCMFLTIFPSYSYCFMFNVGAIDST